MIKYKQNIKHISCNNLVFRYKYLVREKNLSYANIVALLVCFVK